MKTLTCIYGRGSFPSGQRLASELLVEGLRERGWDVRVIQTPLLDRLRKRRVDSWAQALSLGFRFAIAWLRGAVVAVGRKPLYVNLGQTRFALIRDGLPLLIRGLLRRDEWGIISLHGNLFALWRRSSIEARLLRGAARGARYVTVLGEAQRGRLIDLGVAPAKAVLVDNTCSLRPVTPEACARKQERANSGALRVLFLSNLIESKGYPEFIEAVGQVAQTSGVPVEATLCGQVMRMEGDSRFATTDQAKDWIQNRLAEINQSGTVRLRWVRGAFGEHKERLFEEAHVFVLPTRYAVESQPIAILEALATGCAVITTKAGEIPAMVDEQTAVLLEDGSPESIAEAVTTLSSDGPRRKELALRGLALFRGRFSYSQYLDHWEALLQELLG